MIPLLRLVTAPASEPITLAEARMHLRLTATGSPLAHPEDDLVSALITAARERAEAFTHRALVTQAYAYELDAWPACGEIVLPRPPLQAVTSITYVDLDGVTQTLDTDLYMVRRPTGTFADRGSVIPAYNAVLPSIRCYPGALVVNFSAGYGNGGSPDDSVAAVPASIKAAIKLLVGHWYEHREEVAMGVAVAPLPTGVEALLTPFKSLVF